jgi:polysaccharide biosynthesis/export protein
MSSIVVAHKLRWWVRNTSRHLPLTATSLGVPVAAGFLLICLLSGCQTNKAPVGENTFSDVPKAGETKSPEAAKPDVIVLHEGDTVRITFPGAPTLNAVQQIRRDGRITLPLIGEFKAAGLTPPEMEKELVKQYGPQLQSKEVTVSVDSSAFPIYVTGAVLRPGKILSDRPLTALEAIMEAGVDYNRANLKSVRIVRTENGKTEHLTLNLKEVLKGSGGNEFKLKPQDIIYVPEKFSWF